ncbi:alpha/beta hydrolase [Dactylosporangium vinaceum]|uniref:Alpha/beta fold hydrolase n=1 Tax=Dactylosporangium vinaceum TaxID=53362 RepID=A0ABV5M3E4_9ACTN|nr:alpha/beta hydrolase [Dactylosporangium vinaceum]UAB99802.1 alpha/beta hydrolase [Dactylosporangium vinaceum]
MANEFALLAATARDVCYTGLLPRVRRTDTGTIGGRVSALIWGDRPEVTFLHGAALNAHTWDSTLLLLARPALALDLPGHGDSEWRADFDYAPRTVAPAVAAAVEALTDRPQVLVGQSLGGLVALAVAQLRPDLVAGLVLVDVSPGQRAEDAQQVRSFLAGPLIFESRAQVAELAVAAGIAGPGPALDRGVLFNTRVRPDGKVIFKHHFGSPPPDAAGLLRAEFTDLWPVLEAATVPVLLIRAVHGYLPPDVVAEFAARVPKARIEELDSRHNIQEQRPAELAALIAAFIER